MRELSTVDLIDEKNQLIARSKAITDGIKAEKRMLNSEETEELGNIQSRMNEINNEISNKKMENKTINAMPESTTQRFSLAKTILAVAENRGLDEVASAIISRGKEQMKGFEVTGQIQLPVEDRGVVTASADVVGTDTLNILEPLKNKLVLTELGATFVGGLKNNVKIPKMTSIVAAWADENGTSQDGIGTISSDSFAPKRLTSTVLLSKQLLMQDNAAVESMIYKSITDSIAQKLESTIFGYASGSTNSPAGAFNGVTSGGTLTFAKCVDMEANVETGNALTGNLAYVLNPKLMAVAKTTQKASGTSSFIAENDTNGTKINGYKALSTNAVACGVSGETGIIFANFGDLCIYQWGALSLSVNPYTYQKEGKIEVTIDGYFDCGFNHSESYSAKSYK